MNRQVTRVAWTAMALIVALIVGTTYWQTWARPGLAARQDNEIQRVAEFQVRRGLILAPGRVLARNRAVKRNGKTLYFRRYPQGKLTAHVVGYSTAAREPRRAREVDERRADRARSRTSPRSSSVSSTRPAESRSSATRS